MVLAYLSPLLFGADSIFTVALYPGLPLFGLTLSSSDALLLELARLILEVLDLFLTSLIFLMLDLPDARSIGALVALDLPHELFRLLCVHGRGRCVVDIVIDAIRVIFII